MSEEKMQLTLSINIEHSSALDNVTYNSDFETLQIRFTGGNSYTYEDVSPSDAFRLVARAIELSSWGKAYNEWKADRDIVYAYKFKDKFEKFFGEMHPKDLDRFEREWARHKQSIRQRAQAYKIFD